MRYKIETPVKGYTGKSAGVAFADGTGYTDQLELADWFRSHGYKVTEREALAEMEETQAGVTPAQEASALAEMDAMEEPEGKPDMKPKAGKKRE